MGQRLIATVLIFISWVISDFIFHEKLLKADYTATASLWRPVEQMNLPLMWGVSLITALIFVIGYCQLIQNKSPQKGIKYGVIIGLLIGIGFGFGSFAYMPITLKIAVTWFISTLVNFTIAGTIVGKLVKKELS